MKEVTSYSPQCVSPTDSVAGRDTVCKVRCDLRRFQRPAEQSSLLGPEGHDAAEGTQRAADSGTARESTHKMSRIFRL